MSSTIGKTSEKVLNSKLADVLRSKHPQWTKDNCIVAEQSRLISDGKGKTIDIAVDIPGGVPVVLETEYTPANSVESDARLRLGEKLSATGEKIEQAIAVRIPKKLASIDQHRLIDEIGKADFELSLHRINKIKSVERFPETGWITGDIDDLADIIELSTLSESSMKAGIEVLEQSIEQAASILYNGCKSKKEDVLDNIANELHQEKCDQTYKMAMAIIVNAFTFQMSIAGRHRIKTLNEIWRESGNDYDNGALMRHWQKIVSEINYLPIFQIAIDILQYIPNKISRDIIEKLYTTATRLNELGATSRHDFSGQIFQKLISDRKFLATFYTLPSSASLLAELAVNCLNVDWTEQKKVTQLRIADFACGTGAILNATYHSILSKCRRNQIDDQKIHAKMIENSIVGTDIMPAATHLTASMLAGFHNGIPFKNTSIYTLPYGTTESEIESEKVAIGALDLLSNNRFFSLFNIGSQKVVGHLESADSTNYKNADIIRDLPNESFDLVIMNPPFTRPVNHAGEREGIPIPSFAGLKTSEDEQRMMANKLELLYKNYVPKERAGNGIAGLATNFIDLAHAKLKPGGIIAFVVPLTFVQGDSWSAARELINQCYSEITIIGIANPNKNSGENQTAFSADTGMSEILFCAKKVKSNNPNLIKMVNLSHRPITVVEAILNARKISANNSSDEIRIRMGTINELGYIGSLHDNPIDLAVKFPNGILKLPRGQEYQIPVTTLGELGKPGHFHLAIKGKVKEKLQGPFDLLRTQKSYAEFPSLWNHNAIIETHFKVSPDSHCLPRKDCNDWAVRVWNETKSRLHYNSDFRLTSQPLAACITEEECIGGRAWPNFVCNEQSFEIPLVVWLNSTIGLITYWWTGSIQQPGRTILTKSTITSVPVIDVRKLTKKQLETCQNIYGWLNRQKPGFLPPNEAYRDPLRQELDHRIMTDLLQLGSDSINKNFDLLRNQWCHEPSVHGGKSTAITDSLSL